MLYIRANRLDGEIIYSVYNSRGELALYTRNRVWAEKIAREFQLHPQSTAVVVEESASGRLKRL